MTLAAAFLAVAGASAGVAVLALRPQPALTEESRSPVADSIKHEPPAAQVASSAEIAQAAAEAATTWVPSPPSALALKVLEYPHFRVGYDEQAKNTAWVSYQLTGPIVNRGQEDRPSTFATEFRTAGHVAHRDYSNSGFDRGHLCPAYAIFSRHGAAAMKEKFVMTNVIPQYHGLNAGEWEQLEEAIAGRDNTNDGWASRYGPVWVVNGPIYEQRPARERLRNGTWIPTSCFSVIFRTRNDQWEALAFVMPNLKSVESPISRYLTSIANIYRESHLDILAGFSDAVRRKMEHERAANIWH